MDNATIRRINAHNPDGFARMPTDDDYAAFETWVVGTYGRKTWNEYKSLGGGENYDPSAEDCIPDAAFHLL